LSSIVVVIIVIITSSWLLISWHLLLAYDNILNRTIYIIKAGIT
jgi:hypothetical protein